MTRGVVLPSAVFTAVMGMSGLAMAQEKPPSSPPSKSCAEELRERGLTSGMPGFDTEYIACRDRKNAAVRAGASGLDAQVIALCKDELIDRGYTPGIGAYQTEMNRCLVRRKSEGPAGTADFTDEKPFGRGKIQDYLNALYSDDVPTLRAIDAELAQRMQTRMGVSVFNVVTQNYLAAYPVVYKACLEPNAPTVTVGEVFDEVKRDGNGIEISRRQVDQRRTIPVNRRFLPMARSSGVQMSGSAEDLVAKLAGLELGELSFGNIAAVVQRTMQRRPCSDPVTRRLEEAFVKYSAAGGVR